MHSGAQDHALSPNYERRLAMLQNVPEFEPERVACAVQALTGLQVMDTPDFIPGGLGNENWLVDTGAGRLLVKVGHDNAPIAKWRSAAIALDLATRAGLPVPRLVTTHERFNALNGRAVRVFEAAEGYTLDDLAGPGQAPHRVWAELGLAIRRLHTIRLDTFSSRLDGSAPSFATWDAYLAYRIPQARERVRASRWLDDRTLAPLWSAIQAAACRLAPVIHPALTHRDLHVGNVLISPSGCLAAIVDWDQAEAWDPVGDFFKLHWLLFDEVAGSESAFVKGYGSPVTAHRHFAERLHIVSALGLLDTIVGSLPHEGSAVRRLHARLQATVAAAGWPRVPDLV